MENFPAVLDLFVVLFAALVAVAIVFVPLYYLVGWYERAHPELREPRARRDDEDGPL